MFLKSISIFLFAISALESFASDPCAEGSFFQRLSQLNGENHIGDCVVEVHVCEKRNSSAALPSYLRNGPVENAPFWIGDIYVKDSKGKSLYLPLFSPKSHFPRTTVELTETSKQFTYQYKDKNYDPKSGLKEKYEFTIFKGRQRIEVKMKNSRESRRNPIRSLFFPNLFISCEEKL